MKAILEFDAPESCLLCPLCETSRMRGGQVISAWCKLTENGVIRYSTSRALFCPLKIIEERARAATGPSGDDLDEQMPFEARLRRARQSGDTLGALKVKQEAAAAGIVLL